MSSAPTPRFPIRALLTAPLTVLVLALAATLAFAHIYRASRTQTAEDAFHRASEDIRQRILGRLQDNEQVLRGGVGLFAASRDVSREEWRQYVAALRLDQHHPGIQGVGFTRWITPDELKGVEDQVRSEGFPDFQIRPPGPRPDTTAILYLEPFDWRNQRAFGYDMFSEPVRRAAMRQAMETGRASIAARVTLVQETEADVQPGLLMYLPIYQRGASVDTPAERRRALLGFSYSPVRFRDFMQSTFERLPHALGFELYAADHPSSEALMFRSAPSGHAEPGFHRDLAFEAYGMRWLLRTWSLAAFEETLRRDISKAVLGGGVFISLLLAVIAHMLNQARVKALASSRAVAESEAKYHALFDLGPDAIALVDPARDAILDLNAQACQQLGYPREALTALTLADLEPDVCPELRHTRYDKLMAEGHGEYHTVLRTRSGDPREIHVCARKSTLHGQQVLTCAWRDVTRQRQDERLLQARLHLIEFSQTHALQDLLTETLDRLEALTGSTLGFCQILHGQEGMAPQQARATRTPAEHPWPPPSLWQHCVQWQTPVVHHAGPVLCQGPSGSDHREMAVPVLRGGSLVAVIGLADKPTDYTEEDLALVSHFADLAWDIAERKAVKQALQDREASLRNQNAFLSTLLEHLDIGVVMVAIPGGHPLVANARAKALLGPGILPGEEGPRYPLHQDAPAAPLQDPLVLAAQGGNAHLPNLRVVHPDGREIPLEAHLIPVLDDQGQPWACLASFHDLTDRQRAEREREHLWAKLMQTQKMESLGTLAGGVAHDMNNVLAAIQGLAAAQALGLPDPHPVQRTLHTIEKACIRGGEMVKRLLAFARRRPTEVQPVDLNALLRDAVHLMERTTLARIQVVQELAPDLRPVPGDAGALSHALMNLCINAAEAMPAGGTLRLTTRNLPEGGVEAVVADTGVGMTPEVMEKAIDPFFTTKETGKGTGLGLAMVFNTVQGHGGRLELTSAPLEGTRVTLHLPGCPEAEAAGLPGDAEAEAEAPPAAPWTGLDILVVDDDDMVLESTLELLRALGHHATGVPCGEDALARLEAGVHPDFVLLDMNMPGLGGAGTLPRLRLLAPDLPVALATGRVEGSTLELEQAHPRVRILPKPYTIRDLHQVMEALQVCPSQGRG